jgi:hypothetical protein
MRPDLDKAETSPGRFCKRPAAVLCVLGLVGLGLLVAIILTAPHQLVYDERFFAPNVRLYQELGFSRSFLLAMKHQAAGPLYQIVHSFFAPLTGLQPPGIRLVNLAFLIGIMVFTGMALQWRGCRTAWLHAMTPLAFVPMWKLSGMALTEIPSMFFVSLWLCLVLFAHNRHERRPLVSFSILGLSGVVMSLAILGRSPNLLALMALPVLALRSRHRLPLVAGMIPALAFSMIVPLYVFWVWGGLVSPDASTRSAFNPGNLYLSIMYLSMMVMLVSPAWFRLPKPWPAACVATLIVLTLLNRFLGFSFLPLATALPWFVPPVVQAWLGPLLAALGFLLSCIFSVSVALLAWRKREDPEMLFLVLGLGLLLASSVGISRFSSRYAAQAIPFLLLILPEKDSVSLAKVAGWTVAMALGAISLLSFYPR